MKEELKRLETESKIFMKTVDMWSRTSAAHDNNDPEYPELFRNAFKGLEQLRTVIHKNELNDIPALQDKYRSILVRIDEWIHLATMGMNHLKPEMLRLGSEIQQYYDRVVLLIWWHRI